MTLIKYLFGLPGLLIESVVDVFSHYVLKKPFKIHNDRVDDENGVAFGRSTYIVAFIFWCCVGSWFLYQSQFTYVTYVYACRANSETCYKVQADYVEGHCEGDGAYCKDSYIKKIHFDNGGYISFGNCDTTKKNNKWSCTASDKEEGVWDIQMGDQIKIRK